MSDWQKQAACRDWPAEWWFPDYPATSGGRRLAREQEESARAVCATCPVLIDCLTYAVQNRQRDGIWGGTTDPERAHLYPTGVNA